MQTTPFRYRAEMSKKGQYHLVADSDNDTEDDTIQLTKHTGKRKLLVFVVCCIVVTVLLILIGVGLALYFTVFKKTDKTNSDCITPDVCNSKLLDYIDPSFDPCTDFYSFSCGNWLSANPLDGDRSIQAVSYSLILDNYDHLEGYLSQPVRESDPVAIKKSKYMYSACKDVDFIENNLVDHLQEFIRSAGGWDSIGISPDNGWDINNDLARHHYLGSSAFFGIGVTPDDLNSSNPIIKIAQAGLTLSSPQQYTDGDNFLGLVDEITNVLNTVSDLGEDSSVLAKDIANYERSLALEWLTDTELRNLTAIYNPMTLEELSDLFNMDWVQYFDMIFSESGVTTQFTNDTTVVVLTPSYFENINSLVFNDQLSVVDTQAVNYARWQLLLGEVSFAAASLDNGWDIIRKIKHPATTASEATQLACVQAVESAMPFAVARPFVEEFITDEVINRVNDTANEILETFTDRIIAKDWLDDVTKERCIDKVEAITRQIAYPDFIKVDSELNKYYEKLAIGSSDTYFKIGAAVREFQNYQQLSQYLRPIDKSEWASDPTEVNAYYSPQANQFVFLAGILRPPFFAANWPPFLLYGAFGSVVGHELTHGFDDQGQQFNKDGNRVQWWTDESIVEFKERTQCFVNQYDQYTLQGYQIDGRLTLGENIADNGGVHTAFQAYKNMINQTNQNQATIGGYTQDQLFFVSFAQLWCSRFSDSYLETLTQTDSHSPGPIRVLGSLVNNLEFAAAFNCSVGSRMNPDKKCELW